MLVCFFTLFYSILLLPIRSFKFLLSLKVITDSFWKIYLHDLFFGYLCLYSVETGYRLVLTEFSWFEVVLSLSFEISFQSTFSTDFICLIISSRVLPWLNNLCLSSSQCWLKSFGVVRVHLILSTWLYEIFSFNDLGRSESTWRKFWR